MDQLNNLKPLTKNTFFKKRHSRGRGEKLMVKIRIINLLTMYMFNFIQMHFLLSSTGLLIWKIKAPTYVSAGSETKVSGIHLCQWGSQSAPMFLFFPPYSMKLGMSLMLGDISVTEVCEMLWELPTEREVQHKNLCTHWLRSLCQCSAKMLLS